jgi:hypothetical protein
MLWDPSAVATTPPRSAEFLLLPQFAVGPDVPVLNEETAVREPGGDEHTGPVGPRRRNGPCGYGSNRDARLGGAEPLDLGPIGTGAPGNQAQGVVPVPQHGDEAALAATDHGDVVDRPVGRDVALDLRPARIVDPPDEESQLVRAVPHGSDEQVRVSVGQPGDRDARDLAALLFVELAQRRGLDRGSGGDENRHERPDEGKRAE